MPNYREMIGNTAQNFNVRDEYKMLSLEDVKQIHDRSRLNFAVCALNVTGDLNVSMMMRSASLLGARDFVIYGRRTYDKRGTVGAQNYMNVHRISGLEDDGVTLHADGLIEWLNIHDYFPVVVEQTNRSIPVQLLHHVLDPIIKVCFIFGNEGMGIPPHVMTALDERVGATYIEIPQLGVLRSHNVAASAAIVMWEWVRKSIEA